MANESINPIPPISQNLPEIEDNLHTVFSNALAKLRPAITPKGRLLEGVFTPNLDIYKTYSLPTNIPQGDKQNIKTTA